MPKPTYIPALDGIRGLAALMIMFLHFMPDSDGATHPVIHLLKRLSVIGQCGVPLFFVLSGFLITRILIFNKQKAGYFINFYLKRALRLFPLYYLYLLITFLIIPFYNGKPMPDWSLTWYYFFYLQNIPMTFGLKHADVPHLWSLAVEEHFYLIWPVVIYYSAYKRTIKVIAGLILFAILCRVWLVSMGIGTYYFTLTTCDSLAMGAFLAFNEKHRWLTSKAFVKILVFSALPLLICFYFAGGQGTNYVQYFKNTIISLFCGSVIGLILFDKGYLGIFKTAFLRYTGKISYGLYVFHPVCFAVINSTFKLSGLALNFTACFSFAYIIATISYYGFENVFLKLKARLH